MDPVDMQIGFDRTYVCSISKDAALAAAIAKRFPVHVVDVTPYCMVCQDEGTENSFAIYELLKCQGTACKYDAARPNNKPATTWLCESCAVHVDISKQGGIETGRDDVKRNFVCQCAKDSPCITETYMVTKLPGGPIQVFRCSRDAQVSLVLKGDEFFNGMPSIQQLKDDPSCWREHARSCLRDEILIPQPVLEAPKKRRIDDALYAAAGWNRDGDGQGGRWEATYTYKQLCVQGCLNIEHSWGINSVSMQLIKVGNGVRIVAGTPKSTVRMYDTPDARRAISKGVTRSATRGSGGKGVSSEGCAREMSDKNGEGTVSYLFKLDGEGPISIEVDAVLPKGEMISFLRSLRDEEKCQAVPTFIPVPKIDIIETNVNVSETDKIEQLRRICNDNGCKYDATGTKFALLGVDVGVERLFQTIGRSLEITGFGTNAAWQWHVVMFRQGSVYLTLYILVAQAPYPGLWVIAQKTNTADGSSEIKMVGEDMAPWGKYIDRVHKKTVERGLWTEYGMDRFYLGYTKESKTLMRCLNSDPTRFGPLVTALLDAKFLDVNDIKRSFVVQAAKSTALFAANLRDMGCSFIQMHLTDEEKKKADVRKLVVDRSRVDLGKYGSIVINMRMGEDPLSCIVPVITSTLLVPSVNFTVEEDQDKNMHFFLSHDATVGSEPAIEPFSFSFCFISDTGDEDVIQQGIWESGAWDCHAITGPATAGEYEQFVIKHDDGQVIMKMTTTCPTPRCGSPTPWKGSVDNGASTPRASVFPNGNSVE